MKITKTDKLKVNDFNEVEISFTQEDDKKEKDNSCASVLSISGYLNKDDTFLTLQIEIGATGSTFEIAGNNFLEGTGWAASLIPAIKDKVVELLQLKQHHE